MTDQAPQQAPVRFYGHATCPMVPPVWAVLKGAGVPYDYVDIHRDDAAREHVRTINNGYESVPTLVFPDGSTLTEPSVGVLQRKLGGLGYDVPLHSQILARLPQLIVLAVIGWGLLRLLGML